MLMQALTEGLELAVFLFSSLLGGSVPGGILATTLVVRLALLPVSYRLALRARENTRRLRQLRPQLERLRERWSEDPKQLGRATLALYRTRGVRPVDPAAVAGSLLQVPVFWAFLRVVRRLGESLRGQGFLWIRDLARPSPVLALAVGLVVLCATLLLGGESQQPQWLRALPALLTVALLFNVSAAFGLYMLGSNAVSVLQAGLVRRGDRRTAIV